MAEVFPGNNFCEFPDAIFVERSSTVVYEGPAFGLGTECTSQGGQTCGDAWAFPYTAYDSLAFVSLTYVWDSFSSELLAGDAENPPAIPEPILADSEPWTISLGQTQLCGDGTYFYITANNFFYQIYNPSTMYYSEIYSGWYIEREHVKVYKKYLATTSSSILEPSCPECYTLNIVNGACIYDETIPGCEPCDYCKTNYYYEIIE